MDDVEEPPPEPKRDDADIVLVDLKDNDSLYWVYWPSILNPGLRFMIGWPMKTTEPQKRGDH